MKKSTSFTQVATNLLNVLQGYTKTIRLLLVMLLTLTVSANVWGANASHTCSNTSGTIVSSKITFTTTSATWNSPQCRIAANGSITFTLTGVSVTEIAMGFSSSGYVGNWTSSGGGSFTKSDTNVTWSGSANPGTLTFTTSSAARLKTISVTYETAASYTVTWTINPTAGGSLSPTNGNSTTVTPNAAYTYGNPAYTVTPAGKANVSQDGNNFTATPSANCTIRINMVEKQKNTYIDQVHGNEEQIGYGTHNAPMLTDKTPATTGSCEQQHWHFMGWVTEANKENPTDANIIAPNTSVDANEATYYAVWAKGTEKNSENIETTITIPNETLIKSLTNSYGDKSFSYEGYTFNLNACVQSSYCQMRDNTTISFIQIPTLPGPITKISCTDCKNASSSAYTGTLHFKSSKTRGNSDTDDIAKITYSSVNSFEWEIDNDTHKTGYLLTSAGLRLKDLSITYITSGETTTYSDYTTQCATQTSYSVTAGTIQNGSIKFSKTGEGEFTDTQLTGLEEGADVHFVVNPTLGYTLSGAPSVNDASDNNVECVDMDGIWMFEMPASNVTVSASCTLKEYKITIDDAIENGTASATHSVAVMGTSITLTPKPAAGYQFKSWKVTKEGGETITVTNNQFTMPASDVTVSAEFTPIIYTITYKNDEHINYTSATPETITIKDTGFELEYSVEDGYELTGVTVTMGGEELVLEEEYLWDKTSMLILPKIDVTGNIVVTFETVATCTQLPTISAATSSDITQTTAMLSCSGISSLGSTGCSITSYGFVWGTTTNPTTSNNKVQVGTTYTTTGTIFSNKLTGLTANTTYYVRPYATNGNGTAYGAQTSFTTLDLVKLTTPTNLSVSDISCSNATLTWSDVAGASKYELRLTNTSTSNTTTSNPTTNSAYLTLAAGTTYSWTVQAIGDGLTYNSSEVATGEDFTSHYTITYNENGGSIVEDGCGTTLPAELPTPTRNHYNFAGWYMDKELNTPATAGAKLTQNTTLYAKWEEIKFTITWSINGNTTNSQELQEGTTITPPAVDDAATYACEDKVFVGWVDASIVGSTNEEPNFITDFGNVKENKIYYAVFATASGDGFTLGQSGDFTIYANVGGTNYYATGKIGATSNGKIVGTTEEGDANVYTFTAISGNNESYTYNIKQGDDYIKFVKKSNGDATTDLATTDTEYTWTISPGVKGTWRVAAEMAGRAIIFRSDSRLFGGYATSNVTQNQSTYYDIEIGGATTYTEYVTSCVTCENVLTISKGNEENGTFTLDKVGEQETCDGLSVLVTPTPAEHYHVASVTASTGETAVNNGDGTYTITYAANSTGESTINVVFEEDTKYTVTWMVNGLPYTIGAPSTTVYADERVATLPTPPEPNAYCGDVFVGWTTENPASGNFNEAPTVYNEQSAFPPATGNQTFYAVFADYENIFAK